MTVSVVVPTYNERDNISPLISAIFAVLPEAEIVVVDDDSPDGTSEEITGTWGGDARVRLIRRVGVRGLPSALADGVEAARGARIAWLDADFNMDPAFLPVLFGLLDDADVAVASRYVPGGADARESRLRVWGSIAANVVARAILGDEVRDYTSGLMAAHREVFESVKLGRQYRHGEYCIDFLYRAHTAGMKVQEIAFQCEDRRAGETKTAGTLGQFISLGFTYLAAILKLRLRS